MLNIFIWVIYTLFLGALMCLIIELKRLDDNRKLSVLYDFSLNDYQLSDKSKNIISSYLTMNNMLNKKIIISMKNDYKSLALLNILYELYDNRNMTLLYVAESHSDKNIDFFEMLYDIYGLHYNINILTDKYKYTNKEYNKYMNYELKYMYNEYSKMMESDIIIQCSDLNSVCNDYMNSLFDNSLDSFHHIKEYENYTIYNPMYNLDIQDTTESTSTKDNIVNIIDMIRAHYPNWKSNVSNQLTLVTKDFNNHTTSHLNNVITDYKNGFIINLDELTCVDNKYSMTEFKFILRQCFEKHNILTFDNTFEEFYNLINSNTSIVLHDWVVTFLFDKIVVMNKELCQKFINNCELDSTKEFSWEDTDTYNTIDGFLNETFFEYYNILDEDLDEDDEMCDNTNIYYENDYFDQILLEHFNFNSMGSYYVFSNE